MCRPNLKEVHQTNSVGLRDEEGGSGQDTEVKESPEIESSCLDRYTLGYRGSPTTWHRSPRA